MSTDTVAPSAFGYEYKVSSTGWLCVREWRTDYWIPVTQLTRKQIDAWNDTHVVMKDGTQS